MTTLPPADVKGKENHSPDGTTKQIEVEVSRDNRSRTYTGEGGSEVARAESLVKKIVNDWGIGEMLPSRKNGDT